MNPETFIYNNENVVIGMMKEGKHLIFKFPFKYPKSTTEESNMINRHPGVILTPSEQEINENIEYDGILSDDVEADLLELKKLRIAYEDVLREGLSLSNHCNLMAACNKSLESKNKNLEEEIQEYVKSHRVLFNERDEAEQQAKAWKNENNNLLELIETLKSNNNLAVLDELNSRIDENNKQQFELTKAYEITHQHKIELIEENGRLKRENDQLTESNKSMLKLIHDPVQVNNYEEANKQLRIKISRSESINEKLRGMIDDLMIFVTDELC